MKICKYLVSNQTNMSNFHPLEVLGRDSETQLQVGEKLNNLIDRFKSCVTSQKISYDDLLIYSL